MTPDIDAAPAWDVLRLAARDARLASKIPSKCLWPLTDLPTPDIPHKMRPFCAV